MSGVRSPRSAAEDAATLPPGEDERIAGTGVMGLAFSSGDYLSLRCMAASFADPYRALWHRSADGDLTVYSTADPAHSCERFIGAACTRPSVRTEIGLEWSDDWTLRVTVPGTLDWSLALTTTPVTRMMSGMGRRMSYGMWSSPVVLAMMGRLAGPMLGVGRVRLAGLMPNGQHFIAAPAEIWAVQDSRASLCGRDLGTPGPLPMQASLGGFWLPQRGIFMRGFGHFDAFDPAHHVSAAAHNDRLLARAS